MLNNTGGRNFSQGYIPKGDFSQGGLFSRVLFPRLLSKGIFFQGYIPKGDFSLGGFFPRRTILKGTFPKVTFQRNIFPKADCSLGYFSQGELFPRGLFPKGVFPGVLYIFHTAEHCKGFFFECRYYDIKFWTTK